MGGGGCGVGLRGRAEQCGKSSERIQSERRLRAGEGGGVCREGLCFASCLPTSAVGSGGAFGVSAPCRQC